MSTTTPAQAAASAGETRRAAKPKWVTEAATRGSTGPNRSATPHPGRHHVGAVIQFGKRAQAGGGCIRGKETQVEVAAQRGQCGEHLLFPRLCGRLLSGGHPHSPLPAG